MYYTYTILYSHSKWPLFAQATPYRALLQPGDTLYLPAYWHHEVCVYDYICMHMCVCICICVNTILPRSLLTCVARKFSMSMFVDHIL